MAYTLGKWRNLTICGEIHIFAVQVYGMNDEETPGISVGKEPPYRDGDIFRAFRPDIPQCLYPVFGHCMVRARQVTDVPFHRRICIHCDTYPCSEPHSYVQGREGPYFHLSRICPVVYRRGTCDKRLLHLRHH